AIDSRPQDRCRLSGAVARHGVPDRLDGRAMLQGEVQQHGGVTGRALDVLPGLATIDEDLAQRAVWIAPDGDGEVLTPKPQVKSFARAALRKDSPDHGRASAACTAWRWFSESGNTACSVLPCQCKRGPSV